ncbi:MAG: helix-turn-helix domain-containing protein [Heliobacteriaceae bacterium]|jgi:transcriptional regulator with XRE-family HTH domain|nr:helix-turn-helix domain-containing protein [Heliobacteriaceae bacterium]
MEDVLLKLGSKIRYERLKRKMSQEKLAELANLNMRTISIVENGQNSVKFITIYKIAEAFGLEINDLVNFKL